MENRRKEKKTLLLWIWILAVIATAALAGTAWLANRLRSVPVWDGGYPVYISEVMTYNTVCPNEDGVLCDWVELRNSSDSRFDLSGYRLSDEEGRPKYVFPAGTELAPGECIVVWCDPELEGEEYASFALNRDGGETVYFMNASNVTLDAAVTVTCEKNESLIRGEDGSLNPWGVPTPGYPNTEEGEARWQEVLAGRSGGVLELSEIMASNTLYVSPEGFYCDWIEVHNPSSSPVSLGGYKLSDREGEAKYQFPETQMLGAGEYLVVWCSKDYSGELYAPFGLNREGGEMVVLTGPDNAVTDSVLLPALDTNISYSKTAGGWEATSQATPGYPNTPAGYDAYLDAGGYGETGLYISEVMAGNDGTITDGDGDFSDWIELGNAGDEAVSLAGWYLSDKQDEPNRWQLPAVTLEPGEYLLVFASGKNRQEGELHTDFSLSPGETVYLTTPAGAVLAGVETQDLPDGQSLAGDGSGTYWQTAFPTPGYPNTAEGYEAFCENDTRDGPLVIYEVMVANTSVNWQEGVGYSDWVELRNVSHQPVELSGYYLTDKKQEKTLWALPQGTLAPGESVIYYCSGNESWSTLLRTHTNFSLSAQGEGLFLYDSAGKPVDWVYLHDVPAEGSVGRAEGENGFYYYTTPTQGGENGPGARMIAAQPEASLPAGVYNDVQELTLELSGGTEIRYTTDGSTPTGESELYTQPISITGTTVIRAVNLVDGQLASDVLTLSYIVNENHTLPVVSLVTDEENLFGPQGIYSNHETAWEQDWEREVSLSFFEEDGGFTIDCGAQIHGQTSRRASEKRSFKVSFRGRYDGPLEYDVFGDGQVTEFTSLLIRGSLEDNYTSYMRDELFADLAAQATDVPAQNYRYAVLYINGEYWGLYSIREHHTEDYFASHYGVDADTVDRQNGTYRRAGAWSDLMSYAEYNDLSQPEAYAYMEAHLDIPEVIDWLILQCYSGNIDVYGNVRFYSSPQWNGGRYVYGLVDMDLTMMGHNTYTVGFDATGQLHGIIPCALLRNETFRDAFLTRTAELLATALSEENVCRTVDSLAAIFQEEVARDLERWNQPADRFTYQVENIKAYAAVRVGEMVSSARTFFGLSDEQMETYFADLQ